MKNEGDIKIKLLSERVDLGKQSVLYECAGDYCRGWVAALEWVLDCAVLISNPADKGKLCKICGSNLIDGACYDCLGDGGCR